MRQRKLINSDEGYTSSKQHTTPCSDCPMLRDSLEGWLGGSTPRDYRNLLHSDSTVNCHVITNQHCAGVAIYRKNVCKRAEFTLPANTDLVFATPMEFEAHHER